MPTIEVDIDTYRQLEDVAAARNVTVQVFVTPILKSAVERPASPQEQAEAFERVLAFGREIAHRYPPGFEADDSRETIYEGRGE